MYGVQRLLLRGLIDWLADKGLITQLPDPSVKAYTKERDQLIETFLSQEGERIWR